MILDDGFNDSAVWYINNSRWYQIFTIPELNDAGGFLQDIKNVFIAIKKKYDVETNTEPSSEQIIAPTLTTEYSGISTPIRFRSTNENYVVIDVLGWEVAGSSDWFQTVDGVTYPKELSSAPSQYVRDTTKYKLMINNFADFVYDFFKDSLDFFNKISSIIARALSQKFIFCLITKIEK